MQIQSKHTKYAYFSEGHLEVTNLLAACKKRSNACSAMNLADESSEGHSNWQTSLTSAIASQDSECSIGTS